MSARLSLLLQFYSRIWSGIVTPLVVFLLLRIALTVCVLLWFHVNWCIVFVNKKPCKICYQNFDSLVIFHNINFCQSRRTECLESSVIFFFSFEVFIVEVFHSLLRYITLSYLIGIFFLFSFSESTLLG